MGCIENLHQFSLHLEIPWELLNTNQNDLNTNLFLSTNHPNLKSLILSQYKPLIPKSTLSSTSQTLDIHPPQPSQPPPPSVHLPQPPVTRQPNPSLSQIAAPFLSLSKCDQTHTYSTTEGQNHLVLKSSEADNCFKELQLNVRAVQMACLLCQKVQEKMISKTNDKSTPRMTNLPLQLQVIFLVFSVSVIFLNWVSV